MTVDSPDRSFEPDGPRGNLLRAAAVAGGVVVLFIFLSALLNEGPLKAGTVAPPFAIPLAAGNGEVLRSDALLGKVQVLDFWSTTCPPCLAQVPVLRQVQAQFDPADVQVVGIAVGGESLSLLKEFARQRQVTYSMGPDPRGAAATAYQVSTLPTLFVIDRTGKVTASHVGYWDEDDLLAAILKARGQ